MRSSVLVCLGIVASVLTPAAGLAQATPTDSTRPKAKVPFAFADFTWLNGNSRQSESVLDSNAVQALAELPSLDELRATLIGLLQAPATKIARVLKEPGAQLARVLQAQGAKAT